MVEQDPYMYLSSIGVVPHIKLPSIKFPGFNIAGYPLVNATNEFESALALAR